MTSDTPERNTRPTVDHRDGGAQRRASAGGLPAQSPLPPLRIRGDRLWQRLLTLGEIGRGADGGITRLSFTPEERAAKDTVAAWMREAGMTVREDAVGNLIGRYEGRRPEAAVVLAGSHVDSVPSGGRFDGPLGVIGAVEAVQTLHEAGLRPLRPIEVIAFTDEEGARFRFGMIGSRGLAGTLTREELEARDADGVSVAEAMRKAGLDPEAYGMAARKPGSVHAYVELHIEQGKVLEDAGQPMGVVTGIAGPLWLSISISGEPGHAGATPMRLRHDALAAAAEWMLEVERAAARRPHTVATVGQLHLSPGGVNIIPGRVDLTLDLRDIDEAVRDEVEREIRAAADRIAKARGVRFEMTDLQRIPPVPCAPLVMGAIRQAAAAEGLKAPELPSGAGHDGMQLAGLCPIGMIFVRSQRGISHQPEEYSTPEDCVAGVQVLLRTLWSLANQGEDAE